MLDIQFIRENPELVAEKSKQKGCDVNIKELLRVDEERRIVLSRLEEARAERNNHSDSLKAGKPELADIEKGKQLKEQVTLLEHQLAPLEHDVQQLLKAVPNMPVEDVPIGSSEDDNVVVKHWGEKPKFSFTPKQAWEITQSRGMLDQERAAKISGSRFVFVKGDLVRLNWALMNWVMDALCDEKVIAHIIESNKLDIAVKPFVPVLPPVMLRTEVYEATGRLKPGDVTYKIEQDDVWLIGSAEHTMCAMYQNEILPANELPIRYAGYSTSFRREAGTYGKDEKGTFRNHQFDKIELEIFSDDTTGLQEHLFLIAVQEYLMQQLNLHYRVLNKCTADIGEPNARGVDIDCWMPGQDAFREVSTADYMTDYQARGLKTRYRDANNQIKFVHTNDATGLVLSRIPIAIIEQNQNEDSTFNVPEVLRPYMGGKERI